MPAGMPMPRSAVRRAAAIARGPHECPSCEAPTWAEPPVPWTDLRDYVVRCDSCDRPIQVHVDREQLLRPGAAPRELRDAPGMYEPVDELLDTRTVHAYRRRLAAALALPALVAFACLLGGGGAQLAVFLFAAAVLPGAWWGPALFASAAIELRALRADARVLFGRPQSHAAAPVAIAPGRWDQWAREERRRARDAADQPAAVLHELERVLDERELRRVRTLAARGDVPPQNLAELARFRRSWDSVA